MDTSSQRGSAILMLFIAVALFGMIAYAFLEGSRGNVSMLTNEASKAASYQGQDCTNAINMAVKRLTARGCTSISYNNDGSDTNGVMGDGSCSIFHPNGGGAKACNNLATIPPCAVSTPGTVCPDGTVYVGLSPDGNARMYTTPSNGPDLPWNNGNSSNKTFVGATGDITGEAYTMAAAAADADSANPGTQPNQATKYCADLTVHSHDDWYLPSVNEFYVMNPNMAAIGGAVTGYQHIAKEMNANFVHTMQIFHTGNNGGAMTGGHGKESIYHVRCVRKDP